MRKSLAKELNQKRLTRDKTSETHGADYSSRRNASVTRTVKTESRWRKCQLDVPERAQPGLAAISEAVRAGALR
jgi:hypothetical protein